MVRSSSWSPWSTGLCAATAARTFPVYFAPLVMRQLVMWDTGSGNRREQTRHHADQVTHAGATENRIWKYAMEMSVLGKYFIALQNGILNFELNFELIFILASFKRVVRVTCTSANSSICWVSLLKFCNWWKPVRCVNKAVTFSTQIYILN